MCHWDAGQFTGSFVCKLLISSRSLSQRAFFSHTDKSIQIAIMRFNTVQKVLSQFHTGDVTVVQQSRKFRKSFVMHVLACIGFYSMTCGTR